MTSRHINTYKLIFNNVVYTDCPAQTETIGSYLCIPSLTHSFTLGLNPSFSANPPYRSLSFFSFRIYYMDFPDVYCYFWVYPSFYFLVFLFLHFSVVGSVR